MGTPEYNRAAWPLLVETARAGDTITYQKVADVVNQLCHARLSAHLVGPNALDRIEAWCLRQGIPDLTAVVVAKEAGIPGADFFRRNGVDPSAPQGRRHHRWSQIRKQVWEHAYGDEPPPDL